MTNSLEGPTHYFVVPVFVSLVIHLFLGSLLWAVVSGPTVIKPAPPPTDTHLIVEVSTYTTASHDGMDLEVVSAVPLTDPPAQDSQSPPEPSPIAAIIPETETVETSIEQEVQSPGTPGDKSPATDATSSFSLDDAYHVMLNSGRMPESKTEFAETSIDREVPNPEAPSATIPAPSFDLEHIQPMEEMLVRMPEFKVETTVSSNDQGVPDSETPERKILAAYLNQSPGPEFVQQMEEIFGRMSESEVQDHRYKIRTRYMKKYETEVIAKQLDCRKVFAGNGLLAIPLLIKSAITGKGCKWYPKLRKIP